jgi:hypothetical protein
VADDLLGDLPPLAIGALYTSLGKMSFNSITTFDLSTLTESWPIRPRPDMTPSQFQRLPGLDNTMVHNQIETSVHTMVHNQIETSASFSSP